MPPDPAPTWKMLGMVAACPKGLIGPIGPMKDHHLLRLRQRPLPRLVPDLVAGQPTPGGLDGEDAGELRRVPPARVTRRALPPQAQGLTFQQVRTMPQWRDDASL